MKHVHFDCIGGASGNMLLGALLDVGAPRGAVQQWLDRLELPGWELRIDAVHRGAIGATHVSVQAHEGQVERHLADILKLLVLLPEPLQGRAGRVFRRLAEAEARVHRTSVEEVHFHEVGAIDAIIDIVGTVAALEVLQVATISASPLPMGHGLIHCEHGTFPNPPPATVELLKNVPTRPVDIESELVTPTGAALLVGLEATFGPFPSTWEAVGYGAGTRILPFPNVVRALLSNPRSLAGEMLLMLETNIDDASPQVYGPLMETLFEAGALDVTLTPVVMKKNRPAVTVSVLCRWVEAPVLRTTLLESTTTLGVREHSVWRTSLPRRIETVQLPYGSARVKLALDGQDRVVKVIPEFEDCRKLSAQRPLQQVLDEVRAEGWKQFGEVGMGSVRFKVSEIPEGAGRVIPSEDKEFAVFNLKGKLYAMDNACPHRGGPLGDGLVEEGVVICPWHGWEFDIKTGENFVLPDLQPTCYAVDMQGDDAEIRW